VKEYYDPERTVVTLLSEVSPRSVRSHDLYAVEGQHADLTGAEPLVSDPGADCLFSRFVRQ